MRKGLGKIKQTEDKQYKTKQRNKHQSQQTNQFNKITLKFVPSPVYNQYRSGKLTSLLAVGPFFKVQKVLRVFVINKCHPFFQQALQLFLIREALKKIGIF